MKGQEMELAPHQLYFSVLTDRNARLATGFTTDRQTQLDVLFDKLERERTLSDQDWALANELGAEERAYLQSLQTAAASAGHQVTGGESAEQLLGIIGKLAGEEIAYDRAQKNKPTAGDKAATASKEAADDARAGMTLGGLQTKYAGRLDVSDIVGIYTGSTVYGEPEEPYAKEILGTSESGADDKKDVNYWLNQGYTVEEAREMATLYSY